MAVSENPPHGCMLLRAALSTRQLWLSHGVALAACCAWAAIGCGKSAEPASEPEPADDQALQPQPEATNASQPRPAASSLDAGAPGGADGGAIEDCVGSGCGMSPPLVSPVPVPLGTLGDGACLACARARCGTQFDAALGADSTSENQADVALVLGCVLGADWQSGNAIPASSCFFADPVQPRGSLVPCYCGSTPLATCVATGPADRKLGCAPAIEVASHCSPVTPVCVTSSGSDPSLPLGDVLQLLNCERAACQSECGFPASLLDE